MPERWVRELQRIDRLEPEGDLLERALSRPRKGDRPRSPRARLGAIAVSILVVGVGLYLASIAFSGPREPADPAKDGSRPVLNGELLYAKRVNDGWSLFVVDPATETERQITEGFRDYGSDWSPDGTKIVYDSEGRDETADIWVANVDGSGATKLIDDGRVPAWSPDGSRIAFVRSDANRIVPLGDGLSGSAHYLHVMDADGSNLRQLTAGPFGDYAPAWSPDGRKIAFLRSGEEGTGLFVMNEDGSDIRKLAAGFETLGAPDWSPDGTTIAIAVNGTRGRRSGGIMVFSAESGAGKLIPGTVVEYPDYVDWPTWSPDGQWLAYVKGASGLIEIVRPDGSGRRALRVDPGGDSIVELAWGARPPGQR